MQVFILHLSVPKPGATVIKANVDKPEGPVRITVG